MFLNPNIFSNLNCSDFLDMRNLQEQIKKAFCYHKLFWPFTVRVNLSSDLKNFRPSASTFKRFSRSLEQFFLTVGQKNFGNKMIFVIGLFPHIVNLVLFEWPCTYAHMCSWKTSEKNVLNCIWILEQLRDMNLSAMAFDDLYQQGHSWLRVIK